MSKTTSIYARVEPEIKEQAEAVLSQLGIPMSSAINIFLRQIVLQGGIPFELTINRRKPLVYGDLSRAEFNYAIENGFNDFEEGETVTGDMVAEHMK